MYKPDFDEDWKYYFDKLSEEMKERVAKKIKEVLETGRARHLGHGLPYHSVNFGGHRMTFKIIKEENTILFYFVGTHKEYEKWYGGRK